MGGFELHNNLSVGACSLNRETLVFLCLILLSYCHYWAISLKPQRMRR
jgi:hypothetical protein